MLSDSKIRSFVIEQLKAIGGKNHGEEMQILCPFHDDSTPSLNVHIGHKITPGSYHCFVCNAHGGWNRLAKALKLTFIDFGEKAKITEDDNPFFDLVQDLKHMKTQATKDVRCLEGLEHLPSIIGEFEWRDIPGHYLRGLGAKLYWDRKQDQDYLHFELNMNGKYMGYTLCAIDPKDPRIQKYQIFAEAKKALFLYDKIPVGETIVLVEGHFDAIRLIFEGINAVAIFGTQNWSDIKKSLIVAKEPKRIVIAFDGDQAGYDAAVKVFDDISDGWRSDVLEIFYLQNGDDPGNMSGFELNRLRRIVDG